MQVSPAAAARSIFSRAMVRHYIRQTINDSLHRTGQPTALYGYLKTHDLATAHYARHVATRIHEQTEFAARVFKDTRIKLNNPDIIIRQLFRRAAAYSLIQGIQHEIDARSPLPIAAPKPVTVPAKTVKPEPLAIPVRLEPAYGIGNRVLRWAGAVAQLTLRLGA